MKKEEFERVDMRVPDYENTWTEISRSSSLCFKINHTDPIEENSRSLVRDLIPGMPESSYIMPPMQIDMGANVKIGNHVFINHGLIIMARGGIEIEDDVMIGVEPNTVVGGNPARVLKHLDPVSEGGKETL